jgi:anti-anti-sigma factor
VIEVEGDLEDEEKDAFEKAIFGSPESREDDEDIALDLSGVTFLPEGSLAVLVHALKIQRARGATLRLIRPLIFVRKKLERTALRPFFPTDDQ